MNGRSKQQNKVVFFFFLIIITIETLTSKSNGDEVRPKPLKIALLPKEVCCKAKCNVGGKGRK